MLFWTTFYKLVKEIFSRYTCFPSFFFFYLLLFFFIFIEFPLFNFSSIFCQFHMPTTQYCGCCSYSLSPSLLSEELFYLVKCGRVEREGENTGEEL